MVDLPRPLPPPSMRDRFEGIGDWRDRLPTGAIVAVIAVVVVVAAGATFMATGRAGSIGGDSGPDVALSLPKADGAESGSPADPSGAAGESTTTTIATGPLFVHAAGAVAKPGVVQVPPGARVADVVAAAGGPSSDADLDQVNLAEKVTDGERVYVPHHGEVVSGLASSGASATGGSGARKTADAIVNLNEASETELETLPGVGPATAQAIINYRTDHGRFRSVDDLLNVRGIGPSKLEQIKPHARV